MALGTSLTVRNSVAVRAATQAPTRLRQFKPAYGVSTPVPLMFTLLIVIITEHQLLRPGCFFFWPSTVGEKRDLGGGGTRKGQGDAEMRP